MNRLGCCKKKIHNIEFLLITEMPLVLVLYGKTTKHKIKMLLYLCIEKSLKYNQQQQLVLAVLEIFMNEIELYYIVYMYKQTQIHN